MKFQVEIQTYGEKMIRALREYLGRRRKSTEGWAVFGEAHKRQLEHKWTVVFLRDNGIIAGAIAETKKHKEAVPPEEKAIEMGDEEMR